MINNNEISALYFANKVEGRSHLDPRKGVFKIVSISEGTCFRRPATMATVKWKLNESDAYADINFKIQLETLKTGLTPLDTTDIVGREIKITEATWHPAVPLFCVTWEMLPKESSIIDHLNGLLAKGIFPCLDSFDDFEDDDIQNWEEY
ncbi:hypothetical protein SAMN06265348_11698 [Pedobacter westerhofensis]|uniref:Uncharacterized protein n=1 Tax=Pedobacter westerhofensis TaxID=425512 RepID=A0A521FQE3_9SPHI|nr:hypothetical protein [Pedobacter westerhofensis]SMO98408.1 hypothetical protein SAMN06265348_11698 [Pedobacter westerhofensis]